MADEINMVERVALLNIRMTVRPAKGNRFMESAPGSDQMDHWNCRLSCDGRQMGVIFSMGSGHHGKAPTVVEVVDCLASDAAGVENARDFADFCGEYGYDTDSRKAERIYRQCKSVAHRLHRLCGSLDAYKALLFNTDRE